MKNSSTSQRLLYHVVKASLLQLALAFLFAGITLATTVNGQGILDRKVSLDVRDAALSKALQELEKSGQVKFSYNSRSLPMDETVTVLAENEALSSVLTRILKPMNIQFMQVSNRIVLRKAVAPEPVRKENSLFSHIMVQPPADRTVTGKVTDENGSELPGVSVVVKGTQPGVATRGTTTDQNGAFTVSVPESRPAVLVFSYVGYLSQEIEIGNRSQVDVSLAIDAKALDEVVVIGYGTVKKSDLTGSVSSLKMDELNKAPVASITQSLAGRTSGVQVTSESGAPGAGVKIRIRGTNSLQGDNDPLYVIDGIPIATNISTGGDGNFSPNALAGINPNDIESMEILKDASAVAIYGSRGANGVVLITTKSGKKGKTKITFDQYVGVQQELKRYDVLNGREFAEYRNIAVSNSTNPAALKTYSDAEIQQIGEGTNWRDEIIRTAPMVSSQLSFSGGSDKVRYYLSGNRFDQDGILRGSNFNRGSFKGSLNFDVSERFKIGTDFTLSQSKFKGAFGNSQQSSYGGGYIDVYLAPPSFPARNPDGSYYHINDLSGFPFANPIENALEITRDQTNLRGLGNVFGEYAILPDLKLKVIVGGDYSTDNIRQYAPTFTYRGQNVGTAGQSNRVSRSLLNTNTLSYNKSINKVHNVSGVLGYETQTLTAEGFGGSSRNFSNDNTGYYSLESGQEITSLTSDYSRWGLRSYLGRLNYNYDGRYFATVTGRYDGSSKFQGKNQYSFFPSVALAWRLGNEAFMKNISAISDMKIRTSYGKTGSQAIPPYQTLDLIGSRNNITVDGNNTTVGYFPIRIPSPNLTWETTDQYDAGLDMSFFTGRVSVTADYFYKRTSNLLLDFSLPITSGFNSILQNRGAMQNKGFEFTLNTINVSNKDFSWNTDFNISFIRNKVLDLGGRDFVINTPGIAKAFNSSSDYNLGITKVGEPLGTFYVLQEDGIIQNADELAAAPFYSSQRVGGRRYVDVNGDGQITADDRKLSGNAQPKFSGGFINNFKYRGFDLSAFFEFVSGNQLYNATRFTLERTLGDGNITRNFYENYWRGEGTSNTFPGAGSSGSFAPSNGYVEDGSFLRLRNLSLGYSLPRTLLQKIKSAICASTPRQQTS